MKPSPARKPLPLITQGEARPVIREAALLREVGRPAYRLPATSPVLEGVRPPIPRSLLVTFFGGGTALFFALCCAAVDLFGTLSPTGYFLSRALVIVPAVAGGAGFLTACWQSLQHRSNAAPASSHPQSPLSPQSSLSATLTREHTPTRPNL